MKNTTWNLQMNDTEWKTTFAARFGLYRLMIPGPARRGQDTPHYIASPSHVCNKMVLCSVKVRHCQENHSNQWSRQATVAINRSTARKDSRLRIVNSFREKPRDTMSTTVEVTKQSSQETVKASFAVHLEARCINWMAARQLLLGSFKLTCCPLSFFPLWRRKEASGRAQQRMSRDPLLPLHFSGHLLWSVKGKSWDSVFL